MYVIASGTGEQANTLRAFAGTGWPADLQPEWSAQLGGAAASTGAVIAADPATAVVLVGRAGAVEAYRHLGCGAATCSPIATIPVDGTPQGMSVSDGHLFVTTGSQLVAFAPRQPA